MLSVVLYVICFICAWMFVRAQQSNGHALPPAHPGGFPIIGHTYFLLSSPSKLWDTLKSSADDCAKQGGVTYAQFGRDIYYLIVDPQDALTASNACLQKHFGFDYGKVWFGEGLITASVPIWKRHRKLLSPAFTLPIIHGFLEIFNGQSKRLLSDMDPHVGKGPFDHYTYMRNITLETLFVGTFGINAIEDRTLTQKYMKAVDETVSIMIVRFKKFWLQSDLVYRLSGYKKKETELGDTIKGMSDQVIQRKKAAIEEGNINNEDKTTGIKCKPFLDLLLELSKNGTLADNEISEELNTLMAAGFETVSNQLTITMMLLGAHPKVQEKLYEELLEVLGPERDVLKEDVNKLVYTNAVLMESLRLFPSVPGLPRYVEKDVKLKNYTMRAGSQCMIYPLVTQLDPAWGAASEQFIPERWLDDDVTHKSKEFAAFGLGKRACLGRTYAMISMKVVLAHFIRRYRVAADMSQLQLAYDFVLKPVAGYHIKIESKRPLRPEL